MRILAFLIAAAAMLGGCATPGNDPNGNNDPYEAENRAIFEFNLKLDSWTLRPAAERYQRYVPEKARDSLRNALNNLRGPTVLANDILQGETTRGSDTATRLVINSTLGLGGLIDVGADLGLPAHDEDFGQTLAVWGAPDGPYLMLPFFGPSNPRDAFGKAADFALDPTAYVKIKRHVLWTGVREYLNVLDNRSRSLESFDDIERDSLDFYASVRSLYRQNRAFQIRNGNPESDE